MRIYLFNPETGVYLGQDFADTPATKAGTAIIPPDATTIAPPIVERGNVPVFNVAEQRWEVLSLAELKSSSSVVNFHWKPADTFSGEE